MAKRIVPTPEQLRELLSYEAETGKLYWKERRQELFKDAPCNPRSALCRKWNDRYAGKEALANVGTPGYLRGAIFDTGVMAHRVIWAMVYGFWSEKQIDHINGVKTDNRIENLREASSSENKFNRGAQSNNTSGFKGVDWSKSNKKWRARIGVNRKVINLGAYATPELAYAAYCEAAKKYHGEFCRNK